MMNRLRTAMKTDVTIQVRNKLYAIGIVVGTMLAVALSQLSTPDSLAAAVPATVLLIIGGSTLLYVAGVIIFEKEEGTLHAVIVSPLRTSEYLWSKMITLTLLAAVESVVMIGGAMLMMSRSHEVPLPDVPVLLLGIIAIGVLHTLIGIILVVRYEKITDVLVPLSAIAMVLQLPFLYFIGWVVHPAFLLVPTSAPTLLIRGAYVHLAAWEWVYAAGCTLLLLIGLTIWAQRAFHTHIVMKVR
ncbi:MAG: ABC transporter permease [Brevibacillus sp.]|nr:ABC transporter permease [Brevibacillus sp.]